MNGKLLTTEAFAAEQSQVVVETFSFHSAVGIYNMDVPLNEEEKQNGMPSNGFYGFYNASESIAQDNLSLLKTWFKVANKLKLD